MLGRDPTAEPTPPIDGGPGKYSLAKTGRQPHSVAGRCHLAWVCTGVRRLSGEKSPLQGPVAHLWGHAAQPAAGSGDR